MRIDILTIFPEMFDAVLNESIIKRAREKRKIMINVHNLRDYSPDKHRKVDDRPFGGGPGMILGPEPIFNAIRDIISKLPEGPRAFSEKGRAYGASKGQRSLAKVGSRRSRGKIILLSPQGMRLNQKIAQRLAKYKHLILICGHYEGIDERVRRYLVDFEISIGDYVLTGGELPAMVVIDCVIRLIPGVLGEKKSLQIESFKDNLLEYEQYTRPADYRGMKVPSVLLSGNHKKIEEWRRKQAIKVTKKKRPDLFSV